MLSNLKRMIRQQEGATAVEYGIMVALIAAVIIAVVVVLGNQTCEGFETVSDNLNPTSGGATASC